MHLVVRPLLVFRSLGLLQGSPHKQTVTEHREYPRSLWQQCTAEPDIEEGQTHLNPAIVQGGQLSTHALPPDALILIAVQDYNLPAHLS